MASSKLSIFKVKLQCDTSWDSIIGSVLQMDSEDLHCVVNEQSKDYIGGYYLISVTQNQKIYNFKADKFETITVKKQNVVKFDIFIHLGKMLLWGSKRSADILITAFLQAANNQLVVDSSKIEYIQKARTAMSEIVIAYLPQSVFLQNIGKALCEIARLDQFPDLIDIDIVGVLGAVRPSAQLAVLLLLCFQAMQQFLKRRDKGQAAVAGLRLCAILLDDLALAINGYLRDRMTNGDRLFLEVDSV